MINYQVLGTSGQLTVLCCLSVVRRETRYEVQILDCVILQSRTCSFSGAPNSGYPARALPRAWHAHPACISTFTYHQSRNTTHHILKSCMTTREVSVCDRSSHGLASCPDFVGEFHVLAQRSGGTTPEICPVIVDRGATSVVSGGPRLWCLAAAVVLLHVQSPNRRRTERRLVRLGGD